jgi:hypothetical protein
MANVKRTAPMTPKLLMTATIVAIALTISIGIGIAEASGGGVSEGGFHDGDHGRDFRGDGFRDRQFSGLRAFRGSGLRDGWYYPGYYGYRNCYLTVYGTTACY